jgi:hypothetical protein
MFADQISSIQANSGMISLLGGERGNSPSMLATAAFGSNSASVFGVPAGGNVSAFRVTGTTAPSQMNLLG